MTLLRDPETGHLVGIEQPPAAEPAEHQEFPKWVTPDPSHVITGPGGHVSVAGFEHHVDRAGNITVLVKDLDEEADALGEKSDKTRLRLVPDEPKAAPEAKPLSPLWPTDPIPASEIAGPSAGEPTASEIEAAHAAGFAAATTEAKPEGEGAHDAEHHDDDLS